jgi:regulator of RNase E activity RraA
MQRSGAARVAGPAITVAESVEPFGTPREAFALELAFGAARRGGVMVFALGGALVSTFGGLAARKARMLRLEGVVIDGACRDLAEVQRLQLPLWSTHVTPTSARRRIRIDGVNTSVTCGGVVVSPGDCIVADETGVVAIPRLRLAEILSLAESLAARDAQAEAAIARGVEWDQLP